MSLNNWPVELVDTRFTDSAEEVIVSCAIHNTCRKFWDWAEQNSTNITVTKHTDEDFATYSTRFKLIATFENQTDAALFNLTFGPELPYRMLEVEPNMQAYFR
jgi:hypothetical protein